MNLGQGGRRKRTELEIVTTNASANRGMTGKGPPNLNLVWVRGQGRRRHRLSSTA